MAVLVVGYSFGLQGSFSAEAVQVKLFVQDLRQTKKLDGLYTYWDENFTAKCLEALLRPLNLHPIETKTMMDKFCCCWYPSKMKSNASTLRSNNSRSFYVDAPTCGCGLLFVIRLSQTVANPSQGFWICPQNRGNQCGFFAWRDLKERPSLKVMQA